MPDTASLRPEDTPVGRLYYGRHRSTFRVGTYLALVRMMGIAHLVTALYGHALLVSQTQARLARTRQTLRELVCSGFDSPIGRAAVQRLRDVHRPIQAGAADYRYVLGTFFLEPLQHRRAEAVVAGPRVPEPDDEAAAHPTTSAGSVLPTGRCTVKVVPAGPVATSIWPPTSLTRPCTMERPRPVPLPTRLVVKKGSKM